MVVSSFDAIIFIHRECNNYYFKVNLKNIVVNSNSNFILNFENQNLRKTFQNFLVTCNVMKKIQKHFSKIEIKFKLRKNI
eukprot:COSAG05_NODE_75_length_21588_cov_303.091438_6_plen_80_part_00